MRIALVAAVSAVCLAMPAVAATSVADQSSIPAQGAEPEFRIRTLAMPQSMRSELEQTHRIRFEKKMLEFFPIQGSGLHFEAGFSRDKGGFNSGRSFNFRGDRVFGMNNLGFRRKVSPGFAIAYDEVVSDHDKFNLDVGMRRSRNVMASQLNRLAALGPEQDRLGGRTSRFGPSAHLTFIHSF